MNQDNMRMISHAKCLSFDLLDPNFKEFSIRRRQIWVGTYPLKRIIGSTDAVAGHVSYTQFTCWQVCFYCLSWRINFIISSEFFRVEVVIIVQP